MQTFEIKVGKGKGGLALDAAKLVEGRCLIQGASGSGKSYLARLISEQTIPQGLQTIILDPEGEFLTLRERCDLLVAGRGGDVPTETRSAKLLARRIAETGVSAVVDMSDLKLDERRRFVAVFLDALDSLPRGLERARLVVIDEAHRLCPESGKGSAESTDAVITLMSQGRKRGLAGVLITQRLSKLRKDAAAEAANVFIGKSSPIDLASAQDMLGVLKQDREKLRSLAPGEFYACGPALLCPEDVLRFQARASSTTHPSAGGRHQVSLPPPRSAIQKILKEFEALPPPKEVEAAQTLEAAKARIRELERDLRRAGTEAPALDPRAIEVAERRAAERERKRWAPCVSRVAKSLARAGETLDASARELASLLTGNEPEPAPAPPQTVAAKTVRQTSPKPAARPSTGTQPPARQRILDALAWLEAIGQDDADKTQLAFLAEQRPTSGGYKNNLGALRSEGLLDYPSAGRVQLTDEGRGQANAPDAPPDSETVQAMVKAKLAPARVRILEPLIEAYPGDLDKDDLAELADQRATSGGYKNNLGAMRSLGVLDYPSPRRVRAADILFIGGGR